MVAYARAHSMRSGRADVLGIINLDYKLWWLTWTTLNNLGQSTVRIQPPGKRRWLSPTDWRRVK